MDTRDTAEQAELRRSARRLAQELSAPTVAGLDDAERSTRLAAAVRESGWLGLRDDDGHGRPLASGIESAIVAQALGATVADVALAGPLLAADLLRRAGVHDHAVTVVAFDPGLVEPGEVRASRTTGPLVAVDADDPGVDSALVLVADGPDEGCRLASMALPEAQGRRGGSDLTRGVRTIPAGAAVTAVPGQTRPLDTDDLTRWTALGLALTSADLVGVMRGVLDVTVSYARERRQYGVPIGSFQAVRHLLADARCVAEGSLSASLYASWAVDELPPQDAVAAGRVAKAYAARAARTVCETAIQVHGGIGNTWECIVHVFLRRALLSTQWFGDDGEQLRAIGRAMTRAA